MRHPAVDSREPARPVVPRRAGAVRRHRTGHRAASWCGGRQAGVRLMRAGSSSASPASPARSACAPPCRSRWATGTRRSCPPPGRRRGCGSDPAPLRSNRCCATPGIWSPRALVLSQLLIGAAAAAAAARRAARARRRARQRRPRRSCCSSSRRFTPVCRRPRASMSWPRRSAWACCCAGCAPRAPATGRGSALAVLLFPAVCATRVDMTVQASLVLLWPLLRDRVERHSAACMAGRCGWRARLLGAGRRGDAGGGVPLHRTARRTTRCRNGRDSSSCCALSSRNSGCWRPVIRHGFRCRPCCWPWSASLAMAVRRPLLLARVAGTLLVAFVAARAHLPAR